MFSKFAMTVLVALVGFSGLHVVAAGPVNAAAPRCSHTTSDPVALAAPTRPVCCTAEETPPGHYTCQPYSDTHSCPPEKPVIRCCYGLDPFHPLYHCTPPE